MRVVAITPIHVTDEELARRQERYTRLAPAAYAGGFAGQQPC